MKIQDLGKNRSEIVLNIKGWFIRMRIQGPGSARERRQLGLAISKIVSKTVTLFETHSWIVHPAGYWANIDRDSKRGISLSRAPCLQTKAGRLGFEIRTKRLKLGCTQVALASRAGINASHLSLIERGLSQVQGLTLSKLEDAFRGLASERESALKEVARRLPADPKKPKIGASDGYESHLTAQSSPAVEARPVDTLRIPAYGTQVVQVGDIKIYPTVFGALMVDLPRRSDEAGKTEEKG
jgi:transcriptional regulator with XRE-family HTH domain